MNEKIMITILFQKMKNEKFKGEVTLNGEWIIWKLTNDITVKAAIDNMHEEGYISINYSEKSISTHWHPELEELYDDLLNINNG